MNKKICVASIYYKDSLIENIAKDFANQGAEIHLWALDEILPSVAQWTRGVGRHDKTVNMNELYKWCSSAESVLFTDDDIIFPPKFLESYFEVVESHGFDLAQPSLTHDSSHSWPITLSRPGVIARQVNRVEQMIFSMSNRMLNRAMPTPTDFWMGFGIELLWGRVLLEQQWKAGIVDLVSVHHGTRSIFGRYDHKKALKRMNISMATHDLAWTPMKSILTWRENGEAGELTPQATTFVRKVESSGLLKKHEFLELKTQEFLNGSSTQMPDSIRALPPAIREYWYIVEKVRCELGLDKSMTPNMRNSSEVVSFVLEVLGAFEAITGQAYINSTILANFDEEDL